MQGRSAPPSTTDAFTKRRFLPENIRHTRQAVGSSGSVSSLDYISEDEESAYNKYFDNDLDYAVHVDPNESLENEAALQALSAEDTDDEGIQGNFTIPVKNGPMDGEDGRRNATSAGSAGNNNDMLTYPPGITIPPADGPSSALARPLTERRRPSPQTRSLPKANGLPDKD